MIVFDIGARYGIHPNWKKLAKYCQFILVDADPAECTRLHLRYKNQKNISIVNRAVTSHSSLDINILANPAMSGHKIRNEVTPLFKENSYRSSQIEIEQTVSIDGVTLDSLAELYGQPEFIKIDIEGTELDALQTLSDYDSVLAIRSEVYFPKLYNQDYVGSFGDLHNFLSSQGFMLLNLDYAGRGDFWSPYCSPTGRYGTLTSTDAVWIRTPDIITQSNDIEQIIKFAIFLLANHAADVALWVIENSSQKLTRCSNKKILEVLSTMVATHLYSLKWLPGQDIALHKRFYESVFEDSFPDQNLFNESIKYNPLEM